MYTIMLIIAANWSTFANTKTTDFSIYDQSLMHFYVPENETYAPIWFLLIHVLILPLIIVIVCCFWFLRTKSKKIMLWDIHSAILASYGCNTTQLLMVVIMKNIAAIPRPDFLSRCQPNILLVPGEYLLSTEDTCTNLDPFIISDGFRSFPSGHSSTIFASQTFLALFLTGKIKVSSSSYINWKIVASMMYPLIIALKISLSRVSDHRHRVTDVLAGDLIGFCFGIFFYFIYFTNPFGVLKSKAYPPRKIKVDNFSKTPFGLVFSDYDFESTPYTESIDETAANIEKNNRFIPLGFSTLSGRPTKFNAKHYAHKTLNIPISSNRDVIFARNIN